MTINYENAILKNIELFLKVKLSATTGYNDLRFQAYIYGKDVLGFHFLWGYIPTLQIFHKVRINLIANVEQLSIRFTPLPTAEYITPFGEIHYFVVKGTWRYVLQKME